MDMEGYVPVLKLAQFPRMKRGGIRPEEILIAAGMSTMLEIKNNAVRSKDHWSHFTSGSTYVASPSLPAMPPGRGDEKTASDSSDLVGKSVEATGESVPSEFQKKECTVLGVIQGGEKAMVQLKEDENKCAIVPVKQLQEVTVTGDEG